MDRFLLRVTEPHRPILALVILAALVYLPCVWARDPWSPDEPRYAEVARQMSVRGDYLLPSLNGTVYGEKPPLFFWLGLAAGGLPGIPAASGVRLVSVLAALGTLLLVFHLGRRLGDARAGWLAALVAATSGMFVLHATTGVIDATLMLLVTAAVVVGLKAREAGAPTLWGAFYVLAGLGLITKGPVALVVAGGTMLLIALAEDGPRRVWAGHPAWGLPVAAAVVALWLAPAVARGGESYAHIILFKQNLGRAYDSWHHKEPATFFLKVFPASFVPWIAALPLALVSAWRARREDPSARVPLIWFCWTFLFFSLVSGKKTRYLLPLFPAASLLVGRDLARHAERAGRRIAVGLVLCVAAAVSLALLWAGGGGLARAVAAQEGLAADQKAARVALARRPGVWWLIVPGAAAGVIAVWGLVRLGRAPRVSVGAAALSLLLILGWTQWVAVPALDPIKSGRGVAEAALKLAGTDGTIVLYDDSFADSLLIHLGRDSLPVVRRDEDLERLLAASPDAVIIARREEAEALATRGLMTIGTCRRWGGAQVCLGTAPRFRSASKHGRIPRFERCT